MLSSFSVFWFSAPEVFALLTTLKLLTDLQPGPLVRPDAEAYGATKADDGVLSKLL